MGNADPRDDLSRHVSRARVQLVEDRSIASAEYPLHLSHALSHCTHHARRWPDQNSR